MKLLIDLETPEPIYEQIVRQIRQAIDLGGLAPGTPLPSVRQLAGDLAINRNTVARAYQILEEQSAIITAGRKGTFVRKDAPEEVASWKEAVATRTIRDMIKKLMAEGLTSAEIEGIFATSILVESPKRNS